MTTDDSSPPKPLTPTTFHILVTLADVPAHGYHIKRLVEERTQGAVRLGAGTLHSGLQRMERATKRRRSLPEENASPHHALLHAASLSRPPTEERDRSRSSTARLFVREDCIPAGLDRTSTPPVLFVNGTAVAYVTKNSIRTPQVDPDALRTCNFP